VRREKSFGKGVNNKKIFFFHSQPSYNIPPQLVEIIFFWSNMQLLKVLDVIYAKWGKLKKLSFRHPLNLRETISRSNPFKSCSTWESDHPPAPRCSPMLQTREVGRETCWQASRVAARAPPRIQVAARETPSPLPQCSPVAPLSPAHSWSEHPLAPECWFPLQRRQISPVARIARERLVALLASPREPPEVGWL
jgi:hypothetical protein